MKVVKWFLVCCSLCFAVVGNASNDAKSTTIGILPFECQSAGGYEWLSSGISDTLIAKFTGTKGIRVVERERLASLANVEFSMLNDELSPTNRKPNTENRSLDATQLSQLGAEYLLVGSYTVIGDNIRISARIVHAETAKINGATALAVRGKMSDIFALETELAEKFAKTCNLEVAYNKLSYTDGKNTVSYRMFNHGKMLFDEDKFAESIDSFVKAQQQNDGFYFAEAHTREGKARIALANAADNEQTKSEIQQDHVAKFEADAAEAAPAFYDLGVALQACGQYEKAIKAYDDYLRWYDQSARPFRWEDNTILNRCTAIRTEEAPYYYEHGKREREQSNACTARYNDNWRHWVLGEHYIYYINASNLICREIEDGDELWRFDLGAMLRYKGNSSDPLYANFLVKRGSMLYFSNMSFIYLIDSKTGMLVRKISTGIPYKREGTFYVFDKESTLLIHYKHTRNKSDNSGVMVAYSIDSGKELWRQKREYSPVNSYHNGKFYSVDNKGNTLKEIDVQSGVVTDEVGLDEPIYQIWPGKDHLLIRCSTTPRVYDEDIYYTYTFGSGSVSKDKRSLLFSYFYNTLPHKFSDYQIPMMDKGTPAYRLISADLFYPRTVIPMMDSTDLGHFISRYNLPWFRLCSDKLYGWTRDRKVRGYNAKSHELLWIKSINDSTSAIDVSGHFIVTKADRRCMRIYSTLSSANVKRCVSAFINKGLCLEQIDSMNEAIDIVSYGLKNDFGNVDANLTLARLHMKVGNMNEALEYYALAFRHSSPGSDARVESQKVLTETIGLLDIVPYNDTYGVMTAKNAVYFEHRYTDGSSISRYNLKTGKLTLDLVTGSSKYWRIYNNYLYYVKDKTGAVHVLDLASNTTRKLFYDSSMSKEKTFPIDYGSAGCFELINDKIIYSLKNENESCLVARNIADGEVVWKLAVPHQGSVSVMPAGDFLMVTKYDKKDSEVARVHRVDPNNGDIIWETELAVSSSAKFRIESNEGCVVIPREGSLVITFMISVHNNGDYWMNPKSPFYYLNKETGKLDKTIYSPSGHNWVRWNNGKCVLLETMWNFAHCFEQDLLFDGNWGQANDFSIVKADFHETHPAALAKFAPLAPLADEFDLDKHVQLLNGIIDSPSKRKALIEKFKPGLIARGKKKSRAAMFTPMGYEPLQNTLRQLLERGNLSELEEKFAARQLMALWQNREPFVDIRGYRQPSGARLDKVTPLNIKLDGSRVAVGCLRGGLMGANLDDNYSYLTKWERMPRFNYYKVYHYGIRDIIQEGDCVVVQSISGIYIYDAKMLLKYMSSNLQMDQGAFTVDSSSAGLKNAVDGDLNTFCSVKGAERSVIGIDLGVEKSVCGVRIVPVGASADVLAGAYIQYSKFSETGTFRNVTRIGSGLKGDEENIITFKPTDKARYFRVVTRTGDPVKIAELSLIITDPSILVEKTSSDVSAGPEQKKVLPHDKASTVKTVINGDGANGIFLGSLIPEIAKVGWWEYLVSEYPDKKEVSINGKPCSRFLMTHAPSHIKFKVPDGVKGFKALATLPQKHENIKGSWSYEVLFDGVSAYRSKQLNSSKSFQIPIDVNIPVGSKYIELKTHSEGSSFYDHSIWAYPYFY